MRIFEYDRRPYGWVKFKTLFSFVSTPTAPVPQTIHNNFLLLNTHYYDWQSKMVRQQKGYGFILNEEGREIFVHYTGIVADGFKALAEGQNVEFEIEKNDKGEQAVNVTVLHKK